MSGRDIAPLAFSLGNGSKSSLMSEEIICGSNQETFDSHGLTLIK